MTKQRHCFVAQVGDAIEALASALDPEREPPFKGDILDLLEWAEKDVLEMNQALTALDKQNMELKEALIRWRSQAFPGTDQRIVIERDFPAVVIPEQTKVELERQRAECDELRQHVTLLRDAIVAIWTNPNWKPDTMPRALIDQLQTAYKGELK